MRSWLNNPIHSSTSNPLCSLQPLLRYGTKASSGGRVVQNFNLHCSSRSSTRSIRMQEETQLPSLDGEEGFSAWYSDTWWAITSALSAKAASTGGGCTVLLTYPRRGLWLTLLEALVWTDSDDKGRSDDAGSLLWANSGGEGREGEDLQGVRCFLVISIVLKGLDPRREPYSKYSTPLSCIRDCSCTSKQHGGTSNKC